MNGVNFISSPLTKVRPCVDWSMGRSGAYKMKKARTLSNSAFTLCPVCGENVPLFSADQHVASCLMKNEDHAIIEPKRKRVIQEKDISISAMHEEHVPCMNTCHQIPSISHQAESSTEAETSTKPQKTHGIFHQGLSSSSWPVTLTDGTRVLATPHKRLGGQWLFEDFVSEQEESELIELVDKGPPSWQQRSGEKSNGYYLVKAWGVKPDYYLNTVTPAVYPMPQWLLSLAERMRGGLPLMSNFHPNEANAVKYIKEKDHWLKAHADHRSMSTELIVNLSLGGVATMTFGGTGTKSGTEHRVVLPRRSLQVMSGDARYSMTHAINKGDFLDPQRISITFRHSPLTHE